MAFAVGSIGLGAEYAGVHVLNGVDGWLKINNIYDNNIMLNNIIHYCHLV